MSLRIDSAKGQTRRLPTRRALVMLALAIAILRAAGRVFGDVPTDFTDMLLTAVASPTALAFTPDGRLLIGSQTGVLYVFQNDALLSPAALDLGASACSNNERGLLGVAVDPGFVNNGYIYVYYTHNADGCVNRVSRFVLPGANMIDPATEHVLIDNIPSPSGYHNGGDLQFGKDGYLYISVGDGLCDYNGDSGCAGSNDAARDENVLLGKILRITPEGGIPPTNPFQGPGSAPCAATGRTTPGNRCQETYAWGLRNPFRIAFDPNAVDTRFFINDVGQGTWEEIDLGTAGADYGWNVREGHCVTDSTTDCDPPPVGMTNPIYDYDHTAGCAAITGGAFVPNGIWPSSYDWAYLFSDYVCGSIFTLIPGPNQTYTKDVLATNLGEGGPITMTFGPYNGTQALYYSSYGGGGQVRRIVYTGLANRSPVALAVATPTSGATPLLVTFDGTRSSDPDGNPITYEWDFGDGSPHESGAVVQHVYSTAGQYNSVLTVRDNFLASATAAVRIYSGNTAPSAIIVSPAVSDRFRVGQTITLQGQAVDAEDGPLGSSRLSWTALLHHNTHTHPFLPATPGNNITITMPSPEDLAAAATSYLEVGFTATDLQGLSTTVSQNLLPHKVDVTFATDPAGFQVDVNGTLLNQKTVVSWEGYVLHVSVPLQTDGSGRSWAFASWSDGGLSTHDITTPSSAATYVARLSPVTTVSDTSVADFSAGTPDANTVVRATGDGEVTLAAAMTTDWAGTTLPEGWTSVAWSGGGGSTVGGGVLTTDGARTAVTALGGPGRAVEFVATFSATANAQHVGFGVDFDTAPWAIFSTMAGGALYARTSNGPATSNTLLPGSWLGTPHRFRIDWTATGVGYAIDGTPEAADAIAITASMRPMVSDYTRGDGAVTVDWLRETPYAAAGTFTSRVLDAGGVVRWATASWTALLPVRTSLGVSIREGNTPTPDATWTAWSGLAGPGAMGGQSRYLQYRAALATTDPGQTPTLQDIQFGGVLGAGLTISDANVTEGASGQTTAVFLVTLAGASGQPVNVSYATADGSATAGEDYVATSGVLTFPVGTTSQSISVAVNGDELNEEDETFFVNLTGAVNATLVNAQAVGTILNDDPLPSLAINDMAHPEGQAGTTSFVFTVRLSSASGRTVSVSYRTADGSATAGVDYEAQSGTLTFAPGITTQTVTVAVNGDVLNEPDETFFVNLSSASNATFSRAQGVGTILNDDVDLPISASLTFTDTGVADFNAGTPDANTRVAQVGDGDLVLKPTEGSDFFGTSLPSGWSSTSWATGGAASVADGQLSVNGSRAYASALYGNSRSMEFVATFSTAAAFQHVGFGVDFNAPPWAIFSTLGGGALYARTATGTSAANTLIPGSWLGVPHRFRIDWNATNVVFSIDGTQVASHALAITASMRPMVSDYVVDGAPISLDWLRMTPYADAGLYLSRVFDAGSPATLGTASWTADVPAGTRLVFSVRWGATLVPDATWTPFIQIPASGANIGGNARYLQYRVDLNTADLRQTAILKSVVVTATIP